MVTLPEAVLTVLLDKYFFQLLVKCSFRMALCGSSQEPSCLTCSPSPISVCAVVVTIIVDSDEACLSHDNLYLIFHLSDNFVVLLTLLLLSFSK